MVPLAFHGGTALRFLYAHGRYSEDLDFALEGDRASYDFRGYLQSIRAELTPEGYPVELKVNDQKTVHSAFVRFPGLLYELGLSGQRSEVLAIKTELRDYLRGKSHKDSNINNSISHSPIISVTKTEGYRKFKFSLIGQGNWKDLASPEEIEVAIADEATEPDFDEDFEDDENAQTKEKFENALIEAREVGGLGEWFVDKYLGQCLENHLIDRYIWKSENSPASPYDFLLKDNGMEKLFIDVKSTRAHFAEIIHISRSELCKMRECGRYVIYRVFSMSDTSAKLRISENMVEFACTVLEKEKYFPCGANTDGILINPENLAFGEEIVITA